MVGDRYSLDIGRELEKEEQVKKREQARKESEEQKIKEEAEKPQDPKEKKFWDNLVRYQVPLALIVIILLGFWTLTRTAEMPHLDLIATKAVEQQLQAGIAKTAASDLPDSPWLNPEVDAQKVARLYAAARTSDKVKNEIASLSKKLKAQYQNPEGLPYFYTPDGYFHYRYTRNVVKHGHAGETLKDGKPFDTLRYPPFGIAVESNLFPYFQASIFKIVSVVSDVSLERVLFFLPVLFGIASLIIFFFVVRMLFGSLFPAFFASVVLAMHPRFIRLSYAGLADTGYINLFLSLVSIFFFLYAVNTTGVRRVLFFALTIVTLWFFKQFWSGWFFPLVLFTLFAACLIGISLVRKGRAGTKSAWLMLAGICALLVLLAWAAGMAGYASRLFSYFNVFQQSPFYPLGFEFVTELIGIRGFGDFISVAGGWGVVLLALAGVVILSRRIFQATMPKNQPDQRSLRSDLFLLVWCIPLLVAGVLAYRFFGFAMPAFVAIAAVSVDVFVRSVVGWLGASQQRNRLICSGLVVVLVAGSLLGGVSAAAGILPLANDGIEKTASVIALNSKPDAIITTWWSLGYIWEAFAQRPTVMDGGNFASKNRWWLAQAFTTSDEQYMKNILRFMYCGGIRTLDAAEEEYGQKGAHELGLRMVNSTADNASVCEPPESFVVITEDMLFQLPTIISISEWDFETRTLPERNQGLASAIYNCVEDDQQVRCANEYIIDLSSLDARKGNQRPAGVHVYMNGSRKVRAFDESTSQFVLVLMEKGSGLSSFLVGKRYADSMLVRMLAIDRTLMFFEPFVMVEKPVRIVTYSVKWEG